LTQPQSFIFPGGDIQSQGSNSSEDSMKRIITAVMVGILALAIDEPTADGRGFGGFRGGGGGFGGSRGGGGFGGGDRGGGGGDRGSGDRGGGFGGGDKSGGAGGAQRGGAGGGDRQGFGGDKSGGFGQRGGGSSAEQQMFGGGERKGGAGATNRGTFGDADGQRPRDSNGRPSGESAGPYGRPAGDAATRPSTGPWGSAEGKNWQSAFAGSHFPTDGGLAHYASNGALAGAAAHSTPYWSGGAVASQASAVRGNFAYGNAFHPAWNTTHPGAWYAAGWAGSTAWHAPAWPAVAGYCLPAAASGVSAEPVDYDYGSSVVYQDNNVYVNGDNVGTAQDYNQQALNLAAQGQQAEAPPTDEWKALGVFALAQTGEKTSNDIFQLAVNKEGVIRGNYYDGLMDSTTPVYGSLDKKSQRAAWTIGKAKNRVFEAGIYNLTQPQCPCLVHIGTQMTNQMLLVRVEQPKNGK
jgi:hypothetical protein